VDCSDKVHVESTVKQTVKYTLNSTIGDINANPKAKELAKGIVNAYQSLNSNSDSESLGEATTDMMEAMFKDMPLRAMLLFGAGQMDEKDLIDLVNKLNNLD
jgi:hypothetical protein